MRRMFNRNLQAEDLPNIPTRGKKNRPADSPWRQQKLNAYRPLLTLRCSLMIIGAIEAVLIVGGAVLYVSAVQAKEGFIDYTNCTQMTGSDPSIHIPHSRPFFDGSEPSMSSHFLNTEAEEALNHTVCMYKIQLVHPYAGDVRFYYGLDNYYQNLRLYFRSRNDIQLQGTDLTSVDDCQPYKTVKDANNNTLPIAPCGAVANSLFTDSFEFFYHLGNNTIQVPWTTTGIIDPEVMTKYKNPPVPVGGTLCDAFNHTASPPDWPVPTCRLNDTEGGLGFENFDFVVWMQTSALPNFRKAYRRLNVNDTKYNLIFSKGLPAGDYTLRIHYNYPVKDFHGTKRFIIAVDGFLGGKNFFLPLTFFCTAIGLFLLSTFLVVLECCPCGSLESRLQRVASHF